MATAVVTLRRWQTECIAQAQDQYNAGQSHFLCLATPGSGKTRMAALLARHLFDHQLIDLAICFAPSVIVAEDFRTELEMQTSQRMNGLIGSRGCAMTYQAMLGLSDSFWALLSQHRVFVIFDEIHHCAGQDAASANAWGEKILCEIQGRAAYTLALTGTPWRSDRIPIVLSRYCSERQQIHCDYQYGLHQSIQDRVCRVPQCIVVDNDRITVNDGQSVKQFDSIKAVLDESHCIYQQLLEHESLISYILQQANQKLDEIRKKVPQAGGLIVAASVSHAHQISRLLNKLFGEEASIATYHEVKAPHVIQQFKTEYRKWIVSVGMISEGTNIPRLHVCCYLTRVKTELYFRQVLGRILRSSGRRNETAYLYMPAESSLIQYAERLADDIPMMDVIRFERMPNQARLGNFPSPASTLTTHPAIDICMGTGPLSTGSPTMLHTPTSYSMLAQTYESSVNIFGRYRNEIFSLRP